MSFLPINIILKTARQKYGEIQILDFHYSATNRYYYFTLKARYGNTTIEIRGTVTNERVIEMYGRFI